MPEQRQTRIARSPIQMRPVDENDMPFLMELYASTRKDIQQAGLPIDAQILLIKMQFQAQHDHYQSHFRTSSHQLIELEGHPIGRLYTNETESEFRLVDITLLPQFRNRGIGTALLRDWISESQDASEFKPLRLRVEPNNQARHLYEALGFELLTDEGCKLHMQLTPLNHSLLPSEYQPVLNPS